jgi:quercetin dioxygenase-like cupin family protein
MAEAQGEKGIDDERVRVITWTLGPGAAIGRHTHEYDYLVAPVSGGTLTVVDADGSERTMEQVPGVPYAGTAGTDHDVVNSGDATAVFVEIELKS